MDLCSTNLRVLLEVTYEAFVHGGYDWESLKNTNTGFFVGQNSANRLNMGVPSADAGQKSEFVKLNTLGVAAIPAFVSHVFGLRGPSITVDTTCSSSMSALSLAVEKLQNSKCDKAVVAGIHLLLDSSAHVFFSETGSLSSGPEQRSFDEAADGWVLGEGCGALVLKRLSKAESHGDPILVFVALPILEGGCSF